NALSGAPFAGEAGAVLTGYFAEPGQVRAAADAIDTLRARFEGVRVVCDPVCADSHGVYVPEAVLTAISEHLLPRADWVTPNRFELALFAGAPQAEDLPGLQAMVRKLDVPCVAVTSAFGLMRGHTGVLMVQSGARAEGADTPAAPARSILFEHGLVEGAPHGTGDLLSALLTAHLVRGLAPEQALKLATASVFELVARSVKAESSELLIAAEQDSIARPMAMVTERQLARARAAG
ncbi:MAG: bifunctional hydroxymethylpyrimidine kinase/phosphomethylpyrimidine kinase, partial [Devosiaceae bacterium]|nr:bifunctional hydroxymethylpyrimidine kinase/phosphomethylpyrimidine kinase [Devosiaceae bacterium MH13]